MSITKEKVIRKTLIEIEERVKEIDKLLSRSHLTEIISVRQQAQELLGNHEEGTSFSDEFVSKIKKLAQEEKEAINSMEKMTFEKRFELRKERFDIERESTELKNELYFIERRKKQY
jgi:hypothetical protein